MIGVQSWSVYHVVMNHDGKFFIAVYKRVAEDEYGFSHPHWYGFLINTGVQNSHDPSLNTCDVKIWAYPNKHFLNKDSYINIGRINNVPERDLINCLGRIDGGMPRRILDGVQSCPILEKKHRIRILSEHANLLK